MHLNAFIRSVAGCTDDAKLCVCKKCARGGLLSVPCSVTHPEVEFVLEATPPKVHRLINVPHVDYSLLIDHGNDHCASPPLSGSVPASYKMPTSVRPTHLCPIGVELKWRAADPGALVSRIPAAVWSSSKSADEATALWAALFREYRQFSIADYLQEMGITPTAPAMTAQQFYYDHVLAYDTVDTSAPVPLFGFLCNPYSIVLNLLSALAFGADATKLRDLRLVFYDHIFIVCLQYYCVVHNRFLVRDVTADTFNEASPAWLALLFLNFDCLRGDKPEADISTRDGLFAYCALPDTCVMSFYNTVHRRVNESLDAAHPFYVEGRDGDEVSTDLWTRLVQHRFRQQAVENYDLEVYKAKPQAHRAKESIREETSVIQTVPRKIYGDNNSCLGRRSARTGKRTIADEPMRRRVCDHMAHQSFSPIAPVFQLEQVRDGSLLHRVGFHARAVDFRWHYTGGVVQPDIVHTFREVVELQDAVAWQLDRFMRVSYEKTFTTLLSAFYQRCAGDVCFMDKSLHLPLARGQSWHGNVHAMGMVTPTADRARYSVMRPSSVSSILFHPRRECSPFAAMEAHPIHSPIVSPAGISVHAFIWMVRSAPVSPYLVNGHFHVPGVLSFELGREDGETISIQDDGIHLRNYRWIVPAKCGAPFLTLKHLYYFFVQLDNETALDSLRVYDVYRTFLLLVPDEREAVRFVWDVYRRKALGCMHTVWRWLYISYTAARRTVFHTYEVVMKKQLKLAVAFIDKLRAGWDSCSRVVPTREVAATLICSESVYEATDGRLSQLRFEEQPPGILGQSPLEVCRYVYRDRAGLLPTVLPPGYLCVVRAADGDYSTCSTALAVMYFIAYCVDRVCVDPVRETCAVMFPEDAVRYGDELKTWHEMLHPRPEAYPHLAQLLRSIYKQVGSNADLRNELTSIAAREVSKLNMDVEGGDDDPLAVHTKSSEAAAIVYKLLSDRKRVSPLSSAMASTHVKLKDAFEQNRGLTHARVRQEMSVMVGRAKMDMFMDGVVNKETLCAALRALSPLLEPPDALREIYTALLGLRMTLAPLEQIRFRQWFRESPETPILKKLRAIDRAPPPPPPPLVRTN
jgi:hypothetical protein